MTKQKNTSGQTQTKSVEVSSYALFGRSQKDKTIREHNQKGWILTGDETIGKNKHRLTFELPPQEKKPPLSRSGCALLIVASVVIVLASRNGTTSSNRSTPTIASRQITVRTEVAAGSTAIQPTVTRTRRPRSTVVPTTSLSDILSMATVEPTETSAPSNKKPTLTRTPRPTATVATKSASVINTTQTLYAVGNAKLRSCPELVVSCEVTTVVGGTALEVIGDDEGDSFNGSTLWYIVDYDGRELYVHSRLVSTSVQAVPPPAATSGNQANNQVSAPTFVTGVTSVAPPLVSTPTTAVSTWSCAGNIYNCSDFHDRPTLMSYWNACPGDPSDLDGNDNDGIPCESIP